MAAVPPRHVVSTTTHVPMMLALTFSTGIVDAVGYLGLDRVFTGNMTGNVVILGMALVGGDDLPIVGPLIALGGFMAGAAIAGRALHDHAAGWATRTTVLFGLVAGLMAAIALTFVVDPEPAHALALTVTGFLGGAMGLQAAAARHIAVKDVTTVVVTSTITGLAADTLLPGGGNAWKRRAAAVLLILAGAAVGSLLLKWHLGGGLGLAALISAAVAVVGHRELRTTPRPTTDPAPAPGRPAGS
jgi:uncharacterized membrane protein YoaK (UPF0700 family)